MHEQISEYLNALDRDACYRVDEVLKESPHEVTERVFFVGANGAEQGPFIRKRLDADSGLGGEYNRLWEAQQAGTRLLHAPRLIECYTAGEKLTVVMEHVRGDTLADTVWRDDPSSVLAKRLFPKICDAVMELHEKFDPPMIHRDLKPSNIMVSENNVTIIDFGIAREYNDDAQADTHNFGTRSYAPPEQFGYGQTDVRSDVYALGMILYYCLTEKTPSAKAVNDGFADANVPPAVQPVLVRATAFDPAARYSSVRELKDAFLKTVEPDGSTEPEEAGSAVGSVPSGAPAVYATTGYEYGQPPDCAPAKATLGPSSVVGIIWDVALGILWILFVIVTTDMILEPAESFRAYAPWARFVMGYGVFGVALALLFWGIADKRPFAPFFKKRNVPAFFYKNSVLNAVVFSPLRLLRRLSSRQLQQFLFNLSNFWEFLGEMRRA